MWVGVLGPTLVRAAAPAPGADPGVGTITLNAAKHRALLAALALQPGRPMSADALVEAIWGPDAPQSAHATLHTYLSVVRRALEPDLPARTPSRYLVSTDAGYELRLDGGIDAADFARIAGDVHAGLGPLGRATAPTAGDPAAAMREIERLDAVLALWRGDPYADVVGTDLVTAERARLAELRVLALEDRATLLIGAGSPGSAASDLESLTAQHPLRERLWTLLAVAQARTGRQADALATLERLRHTLDEQLGIEPSPVVRDLQTAILRQEPQVSTRSEQPAPPARSAPGREPPPVDLTVPEWPLVGRQEQIAALGSLLAAAEEGTPQFAVLVGDPGAGKSRLATEVCLRARNAGATVLVGRCSQEEDAPPLWPWTTALGGLLTPAVAAPNGSGEPPPGHGTDQATDHDAGRFRLWEGIRSDLLGLAADRTVVLVLEDLHWADASSLRVLRHLCSTPGAGRLLVLCTWRRGPTGVALAEAAEALARRHATRLDLEGLSDMGAREVLRAVAGVDVPARVAATVRDRTDGNPFFLVEYARLAHDERRELGDVLASGLPRNVADVVQRRLHQLPDKTLTLLAAGAVVGREFDLALAAEAVGLTEHEVLDLLESAVEAQLLQDLGADRFRFAHALVRDRAYSEIAPSRRERMHATLADLLARSPQADSRAAEIARHWTGAGARHVRQAWQAAARAGDLAMRAHAAEEAADQFATAVTLQGQDPGGLSAERYELLVGLAEAARWSTRLTEMVEAADEAIQIAAELGEPALVVRASAAASAGSIWPVRGYGIVNVEVVRLMREALDALPRDDSELRCRLLLCLAGELYYGASREEIRALVDDGIAMARRLGEPGLVIDACQAGAVAQWGRGAVEQRRALVDESVALARATGDGPAEIVGRFLAAALRCGLGEIDGLRHELVDVVRAAREQRMYFVELAALCLEHSWSVMAGEHDRMAAYAGRLGELDELVSLAHKSDAIRGALLLPLLWEPALEIDPSLMGAYLDNALVPIGPAVVVLMLRKGADDLAAEAWGRFDYDPALDDWYAAIHWAFGAEIALRLGERDLAGELYRRLLPLRDTCIMSGTGPAHGPADAYLALAAAATGETGLAGAHADTALRLCREWQIPQVARWLGDLRDRYGF
jgi:DNA-binding SARP family transcriptional activator